MFEDDSGRDLSRLEKVLLWSLSFIALAIAAVGVVYPIVWDAVDHDWPRWIGLLLLLFCVGYGAALGASTDFSRRALIAAGPISLVLAVALLIVSHPVKAGQDDATRVFDTYTAKIAKLGGGSYPTTQTNEVFKHGDIYEMCRDAKNGYERLCGVVDLREPVGQQISDAAWEDIPEAAN